MHVSNYYYYYYFSVLWIWLCSAALYFFMTVVLIVWHDMAQTSSAAVTQFHTCHASSLSSLALQARFYPLTQCTLFTLLLSDTCRPSWAHRKNGPELPVRVGEQQSRVWPSHTLLTGDPQSAGEPSIFTPLIVSIDTAWHLTPTGLHNAVLLPGAHKFTHIYWSERAHTHIPYHPTPFLTASGAVTV